MSVNLQKDQRVSLVKPTGSAITKAQAGLGWDPARRGSNIDLDASALQVLRGTVVDMVWFGQKTSNDGTVQHSGDNLTGEGEGDDETITFNLGAMRPEIDAVYLTVNSFSGQKFSRLSMAYCRFLDDKGNEIARYNLTKMGNHTGMVIGRFVRTNTGWDGQALSIMHDGSTVKDMVGAVEAHAKQNPAFA